MGRELQKRKRRSSRPAVKQPSSRRSGNRITNPLGNDLVAARWDKDLTATQNFRALGLVGRLNAPTGGAEPDRKRHRARRAADSDPFAIKGKRAGAGAVSEVRVERDPETGRILRVIEGSGRSNPLNDPLRELDSDSDDQEEEKGGDDDGEEWGGIDDEEGEEEGVDDDDSGNNNNNKKNNKSQGIVKQLQAEANRPLVKKVRGLSHREIEWLESLVARHGDDVPAMARDALLNPMQQTPGDISRRLAKLRSASGPGPIEH